MSQTARDRDNPRWVLKVEAAFTTVQENTNVRQSVDPSRSLYLRPSGFNYCPLQTFLSMPERTSKSTQQEFGMHYFTNVGTVTHEVWQRVFQSVFGPRGSHTGKVSIICDWLCQKCGKRSSFRFAPPATCKGCGQKDRLDGWKSYEHEIHEGDVRGHVDEILVFKDKDDNRTAVIIDYKSTSKAGLDKKKLGSDPSYEAQISSYGTFLRGRLDKLGIELSGWVLVYFTRDNPYKMAYVAGEKVLPMATVKRWSKEHATVLDLTTKDEVKDMIRNRCCRTIEQAQQLHPRCPHIKRCIEASNNPIWERAAFVFNKLDGAGKLPLRRVLTEALREKEKARKAKTK